MKCELKPCKDKAEYWVHRDGGINLRYCNYHKDVAIKVFSTMGIELRIQEIHAKK